MLTLGLALIGTPAAAAEDFWQWLTPQMTLSQIQHPEIDRWEARYRRRHLELEVILEDGKDFLYPLALAVADRDMPLELALLPIIESHLDPAAVSGSGARGLWQFLPKTAKHLGLKQDWWHNESADFHRSTQTALDYLDYLHDRFGGWLLSLAAYNAGEGRIWSLMKSNRKRGKTMDYWDLPLPPQTQVYVPKLLGLARVLRDPQHVQLPKVAMRRTLTRLQTPMALDVAQIAKMANISIEQVYRFNPQWLRWGMPPTPPHALYLPVESSKVFRSALVKLDKSAGRSWHQHKVKSGESLSAIAQEHATTAQLIRQLNALSGDAIHPQQQLYLAQGSAEIDAATRQAVRRRTRLDFAPRPLSAGLHRVEPGESLWSIARRYGSSVKALQRANQLNRRSALVPGQLLQTASIDQRQRITYTVKAGDALSLIAQKYSVTVSEIQKWNQLDSATIRPGQKLKLRLSAQSG
ncbi:MAG: LysM peptidoglycan-binding domain-containing protein [Oceanococcus sp.]